MIENIINIITIVGAIGVGITVGLDKYTNYLTPTRVVEVSLIAWLGGGVLSAIVALV